MSSQIFYEVIFTFPTEPYEVIFTLPTESYEVIFTLPTGNGYWFGIFASFRLVCSSSLASAKYPLLIMHHGAAKEGANPKVRRLKK